MFIFNFLRLFRIFNFLKFKFFFLNSIFFSNKNNFYNNLSYSFDFNKNKYLYYDFFFFISNVLFFKFQSFKFNWFLHSSIKIFLNYVYNLVLSGNYFQVLDNLEESPTSFKHLFFNEIFLVRYNFFFKFDLKFLKDPLHIIFLKEFVENSKITLFVILDYVMFYNYLLLFSSFNIVLFSFIPVGRKVDFLDFFFFQSTSFLNLERVVFLSKIYNFTTIALNLKKFYQFCIYNIFFKKFFKNYLYNVMVTSKV